MATAAQRLELLADTLEEANIQIASLMDDVEKDDSLMEIREKLEGLNASIRDAAFRAYDVNNEHQYILEREGWDE